MIDVNKYAANWILFFVQECFLASYLCYSPTCSVEKLNFVAVINHSPEEWKVKLEVVQLLTLLSIVT